MSPQMILSQRHRLVVMLVAAVGVLAGCAGLPEWAGGSGTRTTAVNAPASASLIVVQYRQGPKSFSAHTANEAVGVRVVQTLGVIDGALVAPPPGLSAAEAAALLRAQPGVLNAEPQRAP